MLTESAKQRIQAAYSQLLQRKGYKPRAGQREMIAAIARQLGAIQVDAEGRRQGEDHLCAVEAGTGTGKTVAYVLGALPVALEQNKTLVIATATVLLQEQLVGKDLPDLLAHCGLPFSFSIAKGRGRYLCQAKLDRALAQDAALAPTQALFADEALDRLEPQTRALLLRLQQQYEQRAWDGDRDSWPEPLASEDWQRVTTDHNQCTNRNCAHFSSCSYFLARQNIDQADIIVANHDLVLSDLALGGGVLLPAPEQSLYVFDEAHHLPEKVLNHFSHRFHLGGVKAWLAQLQKALPQWVAPLELKPALEQQLQELPHLVSDIENNLNFVRDLLGELLDEDAQARQQYRFAGGIPAPLSRLAANLAELFGSMVALLERLADLLGARIKTATVETREQLELSLSRAALYQARALAAQALWLSYQGADAGAGLPIARWLMRLEQPGPPDYELFSSPITAAGILPAMLWQRCHGAVLTSATLSALGNFERIKDALGLPAATACRAVASPFNYAAVATFEVPADALDPSEGADYELRLALCLEGLIDPKVATLVVFTARQQLLKVHAALPAALQRIILQQDAYSKQQLIKLHRERVDAGESSVIFGLASMTEGVDLPGDYVNHVIIVKLPFAVPDDPVTQTLSDYLVSQGKNPFWEISLPDAALKLKQACGRLVRTETDRGRITLLDRRILTKRYGQALLASLPDYRKLLSR